MSYYYSLVHTPDTVATAVSFALGFNKKTQRNKVDCEGVKGGKNDRQADKQRNRQTERGEDFC